MKNYKLSDTIDPKDIDSLTAILRYIEPCDTLSGRKFPGIWTSPYETYLNIKTAFVQRRDGWQASAIAAAFGLTERQQAHCTIFDHQAALRYLENDLIAIFEKEAKLNRPPKADLVAAGIDKLNKYGDILTVDTLARTYGTTWEEITKWKYSKVYTILAMERDRSDIEQRYQDIITERANRRK